MEHDFVLPAHAYERNQPLFARIRQEYLKEIFMTRETSIDTKMPHLQRGSEQVLLHYITTGNIDKIEEIIAGIDAGKASFSAGLMSNHPLHQARYLLVSGVTMFCRAAIDGGLPEHIAYTISDCYIRQLDRINDIADIYTLLLNSLREYCQAVLDYHFPICSLPVRTCLDYISSHLHTTITLTDLSEICGLSSHYVSDLFAKELGVRPITYIRLAKLKYASLLLQDTTTPVSEISALLAFPSPSAFSSQFQKQYGMSPTAYRNLPTQEK